MRENLGRGALRRCKCCAIFPKCVLFISRSLLRRVRLYDTHEVCSRSPRVFFILCVADASIDFAMSVASFLYSRCTCNPTCCLVYPLWIFLFLFVLDLFYICVVFLVNYIWYIPPSCALLHSTLCYTLSHSRTCLDCVPYVFQ